MASTSDLECTASGDNTLVHNHIVDTAQAVAHGVLDLRNGVRVRSLDEQSYGFRLFDILLLLVRRRAGDVDLEYVQ
jgi:hypothetical protein